MQPTRVRDLMTEDIYSVSAGDNLATLCDLMSKHHVRHMPVLGLRGEVSGLVSLRDLLRHQVVNTDSGAAFTARTVVESLTVGELMTQPVETVDPETDIRIAAQVMFKHKYGCLPVVKDGRPVGILTEADFVRYLA